MKLAPYALGILLLAGTADAGEKRLNLYNGIDSKIKAAQDKMQAAFDKKDVSGFISAEAEKSALYIVKFDIRDDYPIDSKKAFGQLMVDSLGHRINNQEYVFGTHTGTYSIPEREKCDGFDTVKSKLEEIYQVKFDKIKKKSITLRALAPMYDYCKTY